MHLGQDPAMPTRLGVVSDSHGHVPFALEAVRMLESLDIDLLLHCGDIGSPDIPRLFSAWPGHYVLGNVDYDRESLESAIVEAGQTLHGRFGTLTVEGLEIAFLHGDDERQLRQTLASGRYRLVCCGHTHRAEQQPYGSTLLLNPGALYRARPRSLAFVDLPAVEVVHVRLGE
jgi:uncharacterized protein